MRKGLEKLSVSPENASGVLASKASAPLKQKQKAISILTRPNIGINDMIDHMEGVAALSSANGLTPSDLESMEVEIKYQGYMKRSRRSPISCSDWITSASPKTSITTRWNHSAARREKSFPLNNPTPSPPLREFLGSALPIWRFSSSDSVDKMFHVKHLQQGCFLAFPGSNTPS